MGQLFTTAWIYVRIILAELHSHSSVLIRVFQKKHFVELSLALLTTHANRSCEPPKKKQRYRQ